MANMIVIILVIVGILFALGAVRVGLDTAKEQPIQSTFDSGKLIYDNGKMIISKVQDITDNSEGTEQSAPDVPEGTLIEVGQIPCAIDSDCTLLDECSGGICFCQEGSCFKNI